MHFRFHSSHLTIFFGLIVGNKQTDELNAKKLAIHALASQLSKSTTSNQRPGISISDIEQAGLGKGSSQRLAHNDPRNHGSRFGWLFGAAVPQKSDKSSLATNEFENKLTAIKPAVTTDQNSTDSVADDVDEVVMTLSTIRLIGFADPSNGRRPQLPTR